MSLGLVFGASERDVLQFSSVQEAMAFGSQFDTCVWSPLGCVPSLARFLGDQSD